MSTTGILIWRIKQNKIMNIELLIFLQGYNISTKRPSLRSKPSLTGSNT